LEPEPKIQLRRGFDKPLGDPEDYPSAAPDKELLALLYGTVEEAVLFRHVFPPRFDETATTFFGGLPRVPAGFIWPRGPIEPRSEATYPLTFVAQIDCRNLPAVGLRHLLPDRGWLYFFIDWRVADGDYVGCGEFPDLSGPSNMVMHVPDDGGALAEAEEPPGLWSCRSDQSTINSWLKHIDAEKQREPKTFARWLVEPVKLRTYADEHPLEGDGNSAGRYQQLWEVEQLKELVAALGEPVSDRTRFMSWSFGDSSIRRPGPTFPEAWIMVEIFAGTLLNDLHLKPWRVERRRPVPGTLTLVSDGWWPDDLEQLAAEYLELVPQVEAWVERARARGLFTAVRDADRQEFWSWCERTAGAIGESREARFHDRRGAYQLSKHLHDAFLRGADDCLSHSAELAARIGDEAREALRWKHTPLRRSSSGALVRHQLLGAGASVQGAPERFRTTHLLLMQFDSDEGMNWLWNDCGMLQYWITPQDLKAHRFDRVIVTVEGH